MRATPDPTHSDTTHSDPQRRSADASRTVTGLLGIGFLGAGIFGLFLHHRMGVQFAGRSGTGLISATVFEVNRMHSIVMLVLGAVLLVATGSTSDVLRRITGVAGVAGVVCIAFAVYGLLTRDKGGDKFAFNGSDGALYLVAGALLLLAAVLEHRRRPKTVTNQQVRIAARVARRAGG